MTNKKTRLEILVITLAFGIMFLGCEIEPDEPTYTVWTDSVSYTEFYNAFGTLNDGYYIRYEFTSYEWGKISQTLTNEGKYNWTESEIKNWFIGRGFGDYEANKEKAWLMTIGHGFIASRSGSIVYMILK
ncbi:MAG: hypothetical protein LBV17_04180 [Treponema sp.]|nr:hypothetical protein [Treponema sp.]